ncbi:G-type lectin S-receptor-like serine/threonine-protein kinase B120 isoform X2 [Phragmites australis]|uniref:G-type lectin S-receptor-like serine/threonine-protein kinase B120 isoform X2 n=1 Tax=Phragmites australis TaxID=29695 RepID=UPI002D76ED15|nr:G-type lectin S-receptor-like serine/threonine-protein kinase B120 isoform X2 [Phragmites australis]
MGRELGGGGGARCCSMASSPQRLFPLLAWLCSVAVAGATDTLRQGESLSGAATLVSSPSGVFEVGFFAPDTNLPSRLYLGIWYRVISPRTVVWVANRAAAATSASPSLTLTDTGELRVLDGAANGTATPAPLLWSSNTSSRASVPRGSYSAAIQDSGSLQVRGEDGVLWDSFWHPTDTMLSGMRIPVFAPGRGPVERFLFTSWASETDPSPGRYALGLDPHNSGQAYIWKDGNVIIWRSGQWTGQNFVGIPWRPLYMYGYKPANDPVLGQYYTYTATNTSLQRFVVVPNGTDVCYMVKKSSQKWETVWMQPSNECEYYATCGANAKCTVVQDGKAKCTCLKGFQPKLLDRWNAGNWSQGCIRSPPLGCQVNQSGDGFLAIGNVKWPDFSYWVSTVADETGCRTACQNNCSCGAYVYLTTIGCLAWGNELIDIYELPSGGYNLNLKLPASELREHHAIWKIATIVSVVVLFVLVACLVLWWQRGRNIKDAVHRSWRSRHSSTQSQQTSGMLDISQSIRFNDEVEDGKSHELKVYSLDRIRAATCNFCDSNKLGAGGFGPVYMGKLPGGEEVAVKRLCRNSGQGLEEFKNEVLLIAKLQHRNLVRLLGCCIQGEEKILVYEYMPNKSLDAFLFNPEKQGLLDWKKRFDIIEGIARGLLYLHRDSRLRVVHRDLKASNILLDADMNPKISDFGMARMFGGDQNQFNTNRVVGTFGYMSPEYAMEGIFSVKSDIYSFGVLILEIITGKRAVSFHGQQDSLNIGGYAWRQWNEDKGEELIDPMIRASCLIRQVLRCIHIALLCVQDHADERPDIPTVILMLSSDSSRLPNPRPPTLMLRGRDVETSKSSENEQSHSIGTVSMTQLHGR